MLNITRVKRGEECVFNIGKAATTARKHPLPAAIALTSSDEMEAMSIAARVFMSCLRLSNSCIRVA
jgi:hypothetical protein